MSAKQDAVSRQRAQEDLQAYILAETSGIDDPQKARIQAKEAVDTYTDDKAIELEKAARRFAFLQRVEFVIGALFLIQAAVFMLFKDASPLMVILIFTAVATAVLYIPAAYMDSKAKAARQDIRLQIQAAKKVKLKNNDDGLVIEFN
jgi:hypothetical protein